MIKANFIDCNNKSIYPAEIHYEDKILEIIKLGSEIDDSLSFIMPGFIDAHVHIESSMLIPSEFARIAVTHGTVATISDPHEIANVCGLDGVKYMIENGKKVPFKFYFGAPSCVPATTFETSGAVIDSNGIKELLAFDDIKYLAEMMNFPGVLHSDPEVLQKIQFAKDVNKPVDGHAPGLRGDDARKYIEAGISTDHECTTKAEALDKLAYGMKILIREGSAARNFDALIDLLNDFELQIMFCSDDKHPDSLVNGHINQLCAKAIERGIDLFKVIQAACINPKLHYKINIGLLNPGDPADFILIEDAVNFKVLETYIDGICVAKNGQTYIASVPERTINNFHAKPIEYSDLKIPIGSMSINQNGEIPVIGAIDKQLVTNKLYLKPKIFNDEYISDIENDILKIVVINRYNSAPLAKGFVRNFGFKLGAIASSVAHDSHNIIAIGTDDISMAKAINTIIDSKGGISVCNGNMLECLELEVAGLMSKDDAYIVSQKYSNLNKLAKELPTELSAPFMTLSFLALLVIPHIKLSDLGLFDVDTFSLL